MTIYDLYDRLLDNPIITGALKREFGLLADVIKEGLKEYLFGLDPIGRASFLVMQEVIENSVLVKVIDVEFEGEFWKCDLMEFDGIYWVHSPIGPVGYSLSPEAAMNRMLGFW